MRRRGFLGGIAGLLLAGAAKGQSASKKKKKSSSGRAPPDAVTVWTGATLYRGDGNAVRDASVIVRGGRIVEVTSGAAPPSGAVVRNVEGAIVTPGWIATETPLGLVEVELERSTVDFRPAKRTLLAVRAAHSAADGFNPNSSLLSLARHWGVTSAVATPRGGLVAGTSAVVDLLERDVASSIVTENVALHVHPFQRPGTRLQGLAELRDLLDAARLFASSPTAFERGRTRRLSYSPATLLRVSEALGGSLPVVARVSRASDILRLLRVARTYQLRMILSGAEEAHLVREELALAGVPVILAPVANLPWSFDRISSRSDNAALLHRAGVPVVITTFDAHAAHNLRQQAGIAMAYGLPRDAAVNALCAGPAKAFGMADRGDIAKGKVANFTVWNGDPFELSSWPLHVVVRGRAMSLRTRQTALLDRYRDLSRVPRGPLSRPR